MADDNNTLADAQTVDGGLSGSPRASNLALDIATDDAARIDRFTLLAAIGEGGMGELYAAYDAKLDRKVALKLVRAGQGSDQSDSRLLREAQALAKISHPNVVPVFEVGSTGQRVFVAMEYVRGQTLGAWLEKLQMPSEPERILALLARFHEAALGLAAVHDAGLAHRDFKPDNVVVGDDDRTRLVDFGLARSTGAVSGDWTGRDTEQGELLAGLEIDELLTPNIEIGKLTNTGTLLGTPRYMAPEQWRAQRGDSRSDQFSFCLTLYHALYDSWPYEADSLSALRTSMLEGSPREPPREPPVSPALRAALAKGLARDPKQRNMDMGPLIEAMEEALQPPPRRQGPVLALLALLVVILIIAVVRVVVPNEPTRGPDLDAMIAGLAREAEAEAERVSVADQIAAFEAKGEFERADEVFEAFAGLRDNAGTQALARAWLDRAKQLGARGLAKQQLAALGEALLVNPEDTGQGRRDALFALARVQAAAHEYRRLGPTLLVLDDEPDNAELSTMRIHEAINRRDLGEALTALERPVAWPLAAQLASLVRQLDQVTLTAAHVPTIGPHASAITSLPDLDLDGDGHGELLLIGPDMRTSVLASEPGLRSLQTLELPNDPQKYRHFVPIPGLATQPEAPNWVATSSRAGHALVEVTTVDGRAITRVLAEDQGSLWAAGDLFDGPGWEGWEAYGGHLSARRITGVRAISGTPQPFAPSPSLEALDSYFSSLLVTDLDGDGSEELVVGVDGWWAYDVRVLSPSDEPGQFELAARRKLGGQSGMISFPAPTGTGRWLAVTVPETPPAPRVFSSNAPSGAAPGVYIMSWKGPGHPLELVDQLILPSSFSPRAGDLDGDGASELIVELLDGFVILQPGEDLDATAIWLAGLRCHAIQDLDHDGEDELIVSERSSGQVLVLGSGDHHLPALERPLDPRIPPDPELEPDLRNLWARAETLAMVGLLDQSRATFAKLASLANEDTARSTRQRSAALLERNGARSVAAPLYERAGDPASLERALVLYQALHQFVDAARVAERLAAREGADAALVTRATTLARWAEPETTLDFDLSAPLDDGWRITRPGVFRSEPGGLRIDLLNTPDPILIRRPFEWDSDHLEIEFELDIQRLEWGSMFFLDIVPVDASGTPMKTRLARVRIASVGGGGHYVLDRVNNLNLNLEPGSINETPRMRAAKPADEQRHVRVRLDLTKDSPTGWIAMESSAAGDQATSLAYSIKLEPEAQRAGRYELQLSTGSDLWMRGIVQLERLRLSGAREAKNVPAPTRRERVLLALANADGAGVLELIRSAEPGELEPRDADWLAALALEQLGQWSEARPRIERAIGDCEDAESVARFAYGLLLVPDRFGPTLREVCEHEQFLTRTWEVAWGALFHHPDLVDVHRTATTQLVDLDRCEPQTFAQARACADLLTARSRGWYMQNQGAAADTDLRRALEIVDTWLLRPELSQDERRILSRLGALAHVRLGAVLVIRNLLDAAEVELERAIASDLAPGIIADVIVARSLFEPLHERAIWKRVLLTQAGLE